MITTIQYFIVMGLKSILECFGIKSREHKNNKGKNKYSKMKRNVTNQNFGNINRFPLDHYENQLLYTPYKNPISYDPDKVIIERTCVNNDKILHREFVEGTVCFPNSDFKIN